MLVDERHECARRAGGFALNALTRRELLRRGTLASAGALLTAPSMAGAAQVPPWPSGLPPALVGSGKLHLEKLPSARALYDDVAAMVALGPRFTGTASHNAFIDWIEQGLTDAGCHMLPRDEFGFTRWLADRFSLQILDGPSRGRVPVSAYASYSGRTPESGVTGQLAYLGTLPELGLPGNPQDVATLEAAVARARRVAADWAKAALAGIPGAPLGGSC